MSAETGALPYPAKLTNAQDVLTFWFGDDAAALTAGSPARGYRFKLWFGGANDERFDALQVEAKDLIQQAAAGGPEWDGPRNTLARIIVLDQFSRTAYRATAQAFERDEMAADISAAAIDAGSDEQFTPYERLFFYLPLMHSERMEYQRLCLAKVTSTPGLEDCIAFANSHLVVVEQFGRFPHRNAAMGRTSTPEELAWLASDKLPGWARSQAPPPQG